MQHSSSFKILRPSFNVQYKPLLHRLSSFFVRLFQEMGFFLCVFDKVSMFIMRFGAIVIQDELA